MLGQCLHTIATNGGLIASLFAAGLVGGVTHCAGMCGGFVVGMGGGALVPYHLGRMTTYTALGVAASSLVNLAFIYSPLREALSVIFLSLAGLVFLVSAIPQLSAAFGWVLRMRLPVPVRWIETGTKPFFARRDALSRYALGVLLGFMPCGLVTAALMAAATAHDPLTAGAGMVSFSVGTMPALLAVGLGSGMIRKRWQPAFARISQVVMALNGLALFALAGKMVL